MSTLEEKVEDAIARHGDQAYHVISRMCTVATMVEDVSDARELALVALELMKQGYHKNLVGSAAVRVVAEGVCAAIERGKEKESGAQRQVGTRVSGYAENLERRAAAMKSVAGRVVGVLSRMRRTPGLINMSPPDSYNEEDDCA